MYEQERGKTEDIVEDEKKKIDATRKNERERLEQELRDKLKAEILAASGVMAASAVKQAVEIPAAPVKRAEEVLAEERAAMEARIRAQVEAEARAKAEAEARAKAEAAAIAEAEARERAEMEARIRGYANKKHRPLTVGVFEFI